MELLVTPRARKDLRSLPAKDRSSLITRLKYYTAGGTGQDVGPIRGSSGLFRLRHGDWRAILSVERGTMIVKRVRHRREVYRG
jgi:mRNA interferase RelE/StbE